MLGNPPVNAGDTGFIPGLGRFPGEGNGNPLQYSCLENPMDTGFWQATVHGLAGVRQYLVTKQQAGDCLGLEAMGLRHGVSFWGEENALRLLVENSCEYTKNHVYSFE